LRARMPGGPTAARGVCDHGHFGPSIETNPSARDLV
jgi:hypothetical protein